MKKSDRPAQAGYTAAMSGVKRLGLLLGLTLFASPPARATPDSLRITKAPLSLSPTDHDAMTDPALRLAGAWALSSDDARLGGLSAMAVHDNELRMLSDSGVMLHLTGAGDAAESAATAYRLPAPCGRAAGKKAGDSESISLAPDGSGFRIGLERTNTLCALSFGTAAPQLSAVPAMIHWRRNKGAEAMASLPGKGMAIIGEGADAKDGSRPFLWFAGDASQPATPITTMRYLPPKGFKPGEAAFLPDGRMIILNRKHSLGGVYASVLTLLPAFDPADGATLHGREIARIEKTGIAANYEGMAIVPRPGGATIWMVTDNNYAPRQRTLLLRLEWDERAGDVAAAK